MSVEPSEARPGIGNVATSPELVEMAMSYSRSRVICAAARLGIADALGDTEQSASELATACGADPGSLFRLLRTLASLGVVSERSPGRFALTSFGQPLRKDAPDSAWPGVIFWADLLADSWTYLTESVRSGQTAAKIMESRGIQSRWSSDPEAPAIFRRVMGTGLEENYAPLASAWDFSGHRRVADLGGGGGALVAAILSQNLGLSGMLVDRPESIAAARPRFEADEGLRERCELIAADLRSEVPGGADVYLMKHVLHGYNDAVVGDILRSCRQSLPSEGRLLVVEFVLPDTIPERDLAIQGRLLSDLNMMVVTGGRERSASEWTSLLAQAGFSVERLIPVPALDVSIIEAKPV
jgi:hypothetical protein